MRPHSPLTPCTETAPTGSSTLSRPSTKTIEPTTRRPATRPISAAPTLLTKAHGAVTATRPASMPLAAIDGSGFPYSFHTRNIAVRQPKEQAMNVLTITTLKRRSVAASVETPLKPIHPNTRTMVPRIASGMLWARITRGAPSLANLPMRGPSTQAPARAAHRQVRQGRCAAGDPRPQHPAGDPRNHGPGVRMDRFQRRLDTGGHRPALQRSDRQH